LSVHFPATKQPHGAESFLRSRQLLCHTRNYHPFMDSEVSLPCSWLPYPGLYLEPNESSPHPRPISLRSSLILSSHMHLGFPSGFFPSDFPNKTCMDSFRSYSCYIPSQSYPPGPDVCINFKRVSCYHGMTRPQVADEANVLQIWRIGANILNKQSWTADKGWASSLVGRGSNNFLQ
jgi:hypothetical protein